MTARIDLTDAESEMLREIAERTGKTSEQLLREVVAQFLMRSTPRDRLAALRQARGMWKDRDDLPRLEDLRAEFNRFNRF